VTVTRVSGRRQTTDVTGRAACRTAVYARNVRNLLRYLPDFMTSVLHVTVEPVLQDRFLKQLIQYGIPHNPAACVTQVLEVQTITDMHYWLGICALMKSVVRPSIKNLCPAFLPCRWTISSQIHGRVVQEEN
jgi:hypothetical protein